MKVFIEVTFTITLYFCPMEELIMGRKRKENEKEIFLLSELKEKERNHN